MNGESNILYDTSALIEFFIGSTDGEKVKELFIDGNTVNLVPSIVLAELISKIKRANKNPDKFVEMLEHNCDFLFLSPVIAKKAGELHSNLKKKDKMISLADCVIMVHGNEENAVIISKDSHFKQFKKAKLL